LAWTARNLNAWYRQPMPPIETDFNETPASVAWLLRGDAGQRALIAWHMGWAPARQASGERWLAPYLGQLLEDPYSTVRYIARRSLRALPGFGDFDFDYIGPTQDRARARVVAWTKWEQMRNPDRHGPEVLISQDGRIEQHAWQRLLGQRDNKSMYLQE